jgi:hypothetical protein
MGTQYRVPMSRNIHIFRTGFAYIDHDYRYTSNMDYAALEM